MSNLNKIKTYQPLPDGSPVPEAGNLNPNYVRTEGIRRALGALPIGYIPNGSIQDLLDDLLYPFEEPSIANFSIGYPVQGQKATYQYFTPTNTLKFELGAIFNCVNLKFIFQLNQPANIVQNSLQLLDETQGDQIIASNLNPIVTTIAYSINPVFAVATIQFSFIQNYIFRLSAIDLKGAVLNTRLPVQWRPRMWSGSISEASVLALASITNYAQLMAVINNSSTCVFNTDLNYNKNTAYIFNCGFNRAAGSKKVFFLYDTSLGTSAFTMGQFSVAFNNPITLAFTNEFGITRNYYLYISFNSFNVDSLSIQAS